MVGLRKRVYLAWRDAKVDRADYARWLLETQAPGMLALDPAKLRVCVADVDAEFAVVAPVDGPGGVLSACVSAWLEPGPAEVGLEEMLAARSLRVARYAVTEAVPVAYTDRTWADGERTPGACLVSAFRQRR